MLQLVDRAHPLSLLDRNGSAAAGTPRKPRVLIVDDDDILRSLHAAFFYLEDYEVETAGDGIHALRQLGQSHFDLIVTDRKMPRFDGARLVRAIRSSGNQVPIVMVSGSLLDSPLPQDVADAVAVALPKPARPAHILAAAAFALGHPQLDAGLVAEAAA